ncbi:YusW family protein [Paenibacillus motobuensis]|uniref:Lipoprotein n=1 Tax=Paenibacillus motobuensis TaxID=295324 RepID=A0ABN0YAL1_9BACL
MNKTTTKVVAGIAVVAMAGALILIPSLNKSKPRPLESADAAPSETNSNTIGIANEKVTTPAKGTNHPSASGENNIDSTMTIIYKDSYKTVVLFNQDQIEALTGQVLDAASIKVVQDMLQQEDTWTAQNFSTSEANLIANAASQESNKLQSILTKITQNKVADLKLVIVHNEHHSSANFGADHREQANQNGTDLGTNTEELTTSITNFLEFELEVDYAQGQYEVDYKNYHGMIQAEIEDERSKTNTNIQGATALKQLEKVLPKLEIEKDTPKQDAISRTLTAFQLADNYKEFELKIHFPDGDQLTFKSNK